MEDKKRIFFVSDVHLGLKIGDAKERETRFVNFLKAIPEDTKAVYLLGDIWDFWYEYRDVVPKEGVRVVAQLINLMDRGVEVWFCTGNHDIWCYSFFESLGMRRFEQPFLTEFSGKTFCVGHGDALGGAKWNYSLMLKIFHCRFLQRCFSTLHPWLAYRFGLGWSNSNRRTHKPYHFRGEEEPLWRFAVQQSAAIHVDYFVFGHFHDKVDVQLPTGARLFVLKDWISEGAPYVEFDGESIRNVI